MDLPIVIILMSPLSFLGESGVILKSYSIFDKIPLSKQYSPRVLRRHICGDTVCLCPIKRTPGLNGLIYPLISYLI